MLNVAAGERLLERAQESLYAIGRQCRTVCAAAEGEMWPAALALSVQLHVDRIALIRPECAKSSDRSLERLKAYVMRNLFFCVSEVLLIGGADDLRFADRLVNARVACAETWTNCKHSAAEAAECFLLRGDFTNPPCTMAQNVYNI